MDDKELEFMERIVYLFHEIKALTEEYGFEDRVMSAMVFGLLDKDLLENDLGDSVANLQSVYSYHLEDKDELQTIKDVMDETFEEPKKGGDYEDLFGDFDISLN
tara:strand:+ start:434 stop:745 length:312 start_codon:yes stop_codon:yes gene_type:complete